MTTHVRSYTWYGDTSITVPAGYRARQGCVKIIVSFPLTAGNCVI